MAMPRQAALWFLLLALFIDTSCQDRSPTKTSPPEQALYQVQRIVDGDTVILIMDRRAVRTRLIGIDSPESVKPDTLVQSGGKEATAFLRSLIGKRKVWVEYEGETPEYDQYGRLLVYLYRSPDGLFVNAEMIRSGWAQVYRKFRFRHMRYFYSLEDEAKRRGLGVWGISEVTAGGL